MVILSLKDLQKQMLATQGINYVEPIKHSISSVFAQLKNELQDSTKQKRVHEELQGKVRDWRKSKDVLKNFDKMPDGHKEFIE